MYIKKDKLMSTLLICLFLISGICIVIYTKEISEAIINSINTCLRVIIPSLYGMMILSDLIIKTNVYTYFGKPFSIVSRYVFKMPEELFSIFLISNFAGYPIGAIMLRELINSQKIDKLQAEEMLKFCYAPSPTFIITIIGISLFNSAKVGMIIYLSSVISNFIVAFIVGIKKPIPPIIRRNHKIKINEKILFSSIENSAKTLFKICTLIVFFSILISIFFASGILTESLLSKYIASFIEISNIVHISKFPYEEIGIISALSSIGGICILIQIMDISVGKLNLKKFMFSRLICSVLSFIISKILISTFHINITTSLMIFNVRISQNFSILPSLILILMTFLLLTKKI